MTKTIYKGVEIRQYGTMCGEGIFPLVFTDDLDGKNFGRPIIHDCRFDAEAYIDKVMKL